MQHKDNKKLFEPKHCDISRTFGIHHYAGQVVYDTSDFLDTNRDVIPDDLVSVFHRDTCAFGFVSHLFGNELKAMATLSANGKVGPKGVNFRISPTPSAASHPELLNGGGDEPVSTLTQDFHTRLDNLLRTLVHAKPHFIRCLRPNDRDSVTEFDRSLVVQQIRSLQILETVNLMSGGFPHRMRFKAFNARYRNLAPAKALHRADEKAVDDCETILDCYSRTLRLRRENNEDECQDVSPLNTEWAHGRKHIFLSEGARQRLERLREEKRESAAIAIQKTWRGFNARKILPKTKKISTLSQRSSSSRSTRPRPQPIAGTPPLPAVDGVVGTVMQSDRCDFNVIQQTCALFGLDLVSVK